MAAFLTETVKSLKRDGVQTDAVSDEQVREIFRSVGSGELAKEAVADVFTWLSKSEGKKVQDAMNGLGLKMLSKEELARLVDQIITENKQSVDTLGRNAFGLLMGAAMREARGKADPSLIGKILKERLG